METPMEWTTALKPAPAAVARRWPCLDERVATVLAEYEDRQAAEDAFLGTLPDDQVSVRRDEFLVSVGRATGLFLNLLVRESRPRTILELGTARGYSTLWLAEAACAIGARVVSVDCAADKQREASHALGRAGLRECVDLRTADALDFLAAARDEAYEFVLLDLWKESYVTIVDALLPHLAAGAVVVADNMLKPASVWRAAIAYQQHLKELPSLQTVVLPIGSGLAVSRYRAGGSLSALARHGG
jgi:predicted O-methyltransferase YrrM